MSIRTHKLKVSNRLQSRIRKGYPWVHFYQIEKEPKDIQPGDLGVIYDKANRFLAIGLYDPCSEIRLRILNTGSPCAIDRVFFDQRLKEALILRVGLEEAGTTGYRVVNGENEGFPGFVIDRYGDTVVFKLYTAAWFPHLETLLALVTENLNIKRVVLLLSRHTERSGSGDPPYKNGTVLYGPEREGPVPFKENGLKFKADVIEGQKTGFFLDQRENRERIGKLAKGKTVLNVFSYTGGFSIYSLAGGARSVLEIDSNRWALEAAKLNMKLNEDTLQNVDTRFDQLCEDAFKALSRLNKEKQKFDVVILDPPAFAKNKKHKSNALLAYQRLAKMGARLTRPEGMLFSASCSNPVEAGEFYYAVRRGIRETGNVFEETLKTQHALDHPVRFKEGAYLKGIYCRIKGRGVQSTGTHEEKKRR